MHLVWVAFDLMHDFVVKIRLIKFQPPDCDDDVLEYDDDANANASANDYDNLDSNCMPNCSMPFHQLDSDHCHTFQCPSCFIATYRIDSL